MKRKVFILSVVLSLIGSASAQDTIRYPDTCYMYNPYVVDSAWGSSCFQEPSIWGLGNYEGDSLHRRNPYFLEQHYMVDSVLGIGYWCTSGPKSRGARYIEYVAPKQTWIYGIAATTGGEGLINSGRELDSIYTLGELYNISYITDTDFNLYAYIYGVSNGEVYCIDSAKWIRHNNPYRYFEYSQYPQPGFEEYYQPTFVTYSYEFFFNHPVPVVDTFLIGVRFPYGDSLAIVFMNWALTAASHATTAHLWDNIADTIYGVQRDKIDHCNHHLWLSPRYWGGFFPILTPQDTTRCYPVREVSMFTATDTSITLTWRADNATQWEVEYAEAEGMTAYTVTTTTPRVTLTGLRPTTTYLAHVRAWCARDSAYGEWSPLVELCTTAHQPDDTTQHPDPDTVSVDVVGLFTRLAPNPATGLVTVQSSYSLNHVAVYDVQGHLVLEQKAAGTAATFDVGGLPKGVYVVSIRTAAGTTTKRLMVN